MPDKKVDDKGLLYILIYFFSWLSGIIFYVIEKDNKKVRFHAVQAILLGIVMVVLSFTLVLPFLLWLYSLYIGYKESQGETIKMPFLGDYAEKYA